MTTPIECTHRELVLHDLCKPGETQCRMTGTVHAHEDVAFGASCVDGDFVVDHLHGVKEIGPGEWFVLVA